MIELYLALGYLAVGGVSLSIAELVAFASGKSLDQTDCLIPILLWPATLVYWAIGFGVLLPLKRRAVARREVPPL